MKQTIHIWTQNYDKQLLTTNDHNTAKQFVIDSGEQWLPITIDYGTNKTQRWAGRCEVNDGEVTIHGNREYLQRYIRWPSINPTS